MIPLDLGTFPSSFCDEQDLEEFMTRPSKALVDELAAVKGDIIILGVSGKMGPALARLAKRAAPEKRVVGVARFSEPGVQKKLDSLDIETITCDLLDAQAVAALPKLENVIYMAGRKFGTQGAEELTWAMNVLVPAIVAEAFCKSHIVSFSTGCVYPFVAVDSGGATEDTPAIPPSGVYANTCLGRERMFDYQASLHGTEGLHFRLNYAIDMRYGVLHDIAAKVQAGEAIDLAMGHVNVIWQGDAISQALRCLGHCQNPYRALNVSGSETLLVADLAAAFGDKLGRSPLLTGKPAERAWLSNTQKAVSLFGPPLISIDDMITWTADWLSKGQASLGKPTHYEVRDGAY
jgi:nucleoside-diphosphate-sugar epimerase